MATSDATNQNPDSVASDPISEKEVDIVFLQGTAKGLLKAAYQSAAASLKHMASITEHVDKRKKKRDEIRKLCQDYELYSMNLDGSLLEILQKVQDLLSKDSNFLLKELESHSDDMLAMSVKLEEMSKKLREQAKDDH